MENIHPTKSHLIAVTTQLMYEKPIIQITADEVLEKSHVSKGSMYHHFVDFPDLIEQSLLHIFRNYVEYFTSRLRESFRDTTDVEIVRSRLHEIASYREYGGESRMRLLRMEIAIKASQNPEFGVKIAPIQDITNRAWVDLYTEAIARGWGEPSLDPLAVGILMQSTIAGRMVDDVCVDQMDKESWVKVTQNLLDVFIFPRANT